MCSATRRSFICETMCSSETSVNRTNSIADRFFKSNSLIGGAARCRDVGVQFLAVQVPKAAGINTVLAAWSLTAFVLSAKFNALSIKSINLLSAINFERDDGAISNACCLPVERSGQT